MSFVGAVWKALTQPRTDPRALACPVCGWHRFEREKERPGFVTCKFCDETMPDTELVTRCTPETQRNYRERTYGTQTGGH